MRLPRDGVGEGLSVARRCTSSTKVTNVSCGKAKQVLKEYFKTGESPALGYDCKIKPYEGGATTTCTKGDKKIKHYSAD